MTRFLLLAATIALLAAPALAAAPLQGDCTTQTGRETMRARYSQAMVAWSSRDPKGYDDAQEQLRKDRAVAQRGGEVKLCGYWQRAIAQSRR